MNIEQALQLDSERNETGYAHAYIGAGGIIRLNDANNYSHAYTDDAGTTRLHDETGDEYPFAPIHIFKTPNAVSVVIRRSGEINDTIEITRASLKLLTVARKAFELFGFGTPASWDVLLEWAAENLC